MTQSLGFPGTFPKKDTITLGSDEMPGSWVLEPGAITFGWQTQQGWGLDGAVIKPTGRHLAHPTFLVRFWDVAAWNAFQPLRRKYLSKAAYTLAAFKTYAISILHTELNNAGVLFVAPEEVPWFTNTGRGLWVGTVKFIEYTGTPKPVLESPDAVIPAVGAPQPSAADNAKAETALHEAELKGSRG
jgi:hypothetical protein